MSEVDSTKQGTFWDVPPEKRCGRCKKVKPLTEFGRVRDFPRSYCRACHRAVGERIDHRTEKRCAHCKEMKPVAEFGRLLGGFQPYCNPCRAAVNRKRLEADKAAGVASVKNRRDYWGRRKWARLLKEYKLDRDAYLALEKEQGGLCAICGRSESQTVNGTPLRLAVDHDHTTGRVRGLLCKACNMGIGKFGDDPDRLQQAVDYLRKQGPNVKGVS